MSQSIEERVDKLNQVEFFKDMPGLALEMATLEKKVGYRLPLEFEVTLLPQYTIGERHVLLGKIHDYFAIGITKVDGTWIYKAFENKYALKLFFTSLDGMDRKDLSYWFREMELL